MKLLHVISSLDPSFGGLSQAIRSLVPPLKKLNVHSEVLCLDDSNAPFLNADPFPIHAIGPWKGPWNYCAKLVPWLMDNFHRFDAVIVHGLWLYHSYGTVKALGRFKKMKVNANENTKVPKLFIMPHGMLDPYFQRAPERKLKAIRNWLYWKLLESNVVNTADGLLFTCESELLLAREPFDNYFPKREFNVGLGIHDPPLLTRGMRDAFLQKCPSVTDRPYILFLGRIHQKKGVDLLVKAFLDFARTNGPQSNHGPAVALVVAGPGLDTQYGQTIQQIVSQAEELKDRVFFPGMLAGDAKWGAFYGCEAFILPSHQENFGISVAEALACGKPVLTSNQVNIWKEIESAGAGIVSADTLDGTKNLLARWGKLTEKQKIEMRQRAQHAFKEHFAIDPVAQRFSAAVVE